MTSYIPIQLLFRKTPSTVQINYYYLGKLYPNVHLPFSSATIKLQYHYLTIINQFNTNYYQIQWRTITDAFQTIAYQEDIKEI